MEAFRNLTRNEEQYMNACLSYDKRQWRWVFNLFAVLSLLAGSFLILFLIDGSYDMVFLFGLTLPIVALPLIPAGRALAVRHDLMPVYSLAGKYRVFTTEGNPKYGGGRKSHSIGIWKVIIPGHWQMNGYLKEGERYKCEGTAVKVRGLKDEDAVIYQLNLLSVNRRFSVDREYGTGLKKMFGPNWDNYYILLVVFTPLLIAFSFFYFGGEFNPFNVYSLLSELRITGESLSDWEFFEMAWRPFVELLLGFIVVLCLLNILGNRAYLRKIDELYYGPTQPGQRAPGWRK